MKIRKLLFSGIVICFVVCILSGRVFAGENLPPTLQNPAHSRAIDGPAHSILYPVKFFSTYISGADGDRCQMYPSCSQYCVEAFKKRGAFMGWIMSCDRLVRCGRDEGKFSAPIWIDGEKRINDPVDGSDFLR